MVSIKNIEKFFQDHPELYEVKYQTLGRADRIVNPQGLISSGGLPLVFLDQKILQMFLHDIQTDREHIKIGIEAIRGNERRA